LCAHFAFVVCRLQVAALLLGSLGCIALLGVTQAPRAAHVRVQELMTASDAAQAR
jgi:hypothetical protein